MDLTAASWRTSSYSSSNGGNCVEVATAVPAADGQAVAVRDSKDRQGPALVFGARAWRSFTDAVKAGAFGR